MMLNNIGFHLPECLTIVYKFWNFIKFEKNFPIFLEEIFKLYTLFDNQVQSLMFS